MLVQGLSNIELVKFLILIPNKKEFPLGYPWEGFASLDTRVFSVRGDRS